MRSCITCSGSRYFSVWRHFKKKVSIVCVCEAEYPETAVCAHVCALCVYERECAVSEISPSVQHTAAHTHTRAERDRQSLAHSKGHEYPNLTIPTHTQPAAQPYRENERNMDNGKDPSTCCKWQRSGLNRTDESRHITLSFCVPQHNSIFSRSVQTQMA